VVNTLDPGWTQINDNQTPGWTDILRPAQVQSIAVYGGANFGVISFAGEITLTVPPAADLWNNVDDNQTPGWTPIDTV